MFLPPKPRTRLRRCRLLVGRDGRPRPISLTPIGGCVFDLLSRVGSRGITFHRPPPQGWRKGLEELRRRGVPIAIAKDAEGRLTYLLRSGSTLERLNDDAARLVLLPEPSEARQ